ncbi:MAG: DNA repair exonuclease, partial [Deltaproteobacteria bacterium]|nr:DNA repair exonuclease [Deltaproteobacteria bacterium]
TTSLHGILHERSLHWMEEFRGIAASLIETWLEKTLFHTRKKTEKEYDDRSPISVLNTTIENLRLEGLHLINLIPEFEQLRSKLPPDLLLDDDPFNVQDEEVEALCEDVKELLMGKMLRQEGHHEN